MPKEKSKSISSVRQEKLIESLIEHNIKIQHKMADMIIETKSLNKTVKSLVELFRQAGENIKKGKYEDPLLVKLDDLLEQNKNIAKGLLLLEKFVSEKQERTSLSSLRKKEI